MDPAALYPEPDPRSVSFSNITPTGPQPMTYADLVGDTRRWPVTETTPDGVRDLLRTARATYALAFFQYELFTVSVTWALLAVEAAIRAVHDGDTAQLYGLIEKSRTTGRVSANVAEKLHDQRELRNTLAHNQYQPLWPPGTGSYLMNDAHITVASVFPAAPAS